jgi:hypothetical protein
MRGLPHLRMAVNVSAKQFWGGRIVDTVRRVLKETDLPPSDLELEITESVFLRDIEETVRTLSELKSMGVAVTLDDFGTGYSSLNYLRRLPIDQLKIDGSFIRDLSADPNAAVLLSQIIQWATACETALWPEGTFWSAYCGNRDEAVEGVLDADPVATAVRALMAKRLEWTGTAASLALMRRAGRGRSLHDRLIRAFKLPSDIVHSTRLDPTCRRHLFSCHERIAT